MRYLFKKTLCIVLSIICMFSFIACGEKEDANLDEQANEKFDIKCMDSAETVAMALYLRSDNIAPELCSLLETTGLYYDPESNSMLASAPAAGYGKGTEVDGGESWGYYAGVENGKGIVKQYDNSFDYTNCYLRVQYDKTTEIFYMNWEQVSLYVVRTDWADNVMTAINDFIDLYGNQSDKYDENSYVVSDFDNTASIFDMCEQFMIYQAEVMGYAFTPEELPDILASGLGDMNKDLSDLGYGKGSYSDWISDIVTAYTYLYNTYGPFKASGVDERTASTIHADPMWAEFIVKMMNMYYLIGDNESTDVSYPWITYWYTGMTEDEVYTLAKESHAKYRNADTSYKTIKTSESVQSKVGVTEYTYVEGVRVTDNTVEMWKCLNNAGIDIWVCTASECDIIRAAVDEFGMHDYCTGLIGMTPARVDGKFSYTYDYETGYCWYAEPDGSWSRGNVASRAQIQGLGKTTAVQNICVKEYGCGPIAGFMDSTGDYNFCTEFKNLKLVICFNRADRTVTDGGSVIAELAMYQKDVLGYDLRTANEIGDTLYVLQGRDENGKRSFRNSNKTLKLGETEEKLFRDEKNEAIYNYMVSNKMTTEDIINTFAVKSSDSSFGFKYGFLDKYDGYHSK